VWSGWKRVRRRTYWARELGALGHEVQLMPAQYVKAYIKRNKHDARRARSACCCGAPLRSTARASRRARCATASGISAHDAAQTTFASRVDRRRRSARSTFRPMKYRTPPLARATRIRPGDGSHGYPLKSRFAAPKRMITNRTSGTSAWPVSSPRWASCS